MSSCDVLIVGAGPAGAVCAAFCAQAGLKTLVLERAQFPREKVCGDCLNPGCWPILERLALADRTLQLPHAKLAELELIDLRGRSTKFPLRVSDRGEIAVQRINFDQLLLERALECGAEILQETVVSAVERGWKIHAGDRVFEARVLVAADGRNSSTARLLGLLPPLRKDRVALQTHLDAPAGFADRVTLRFLPEGYCGIANVGGGQITVCLVGRARSIPSLKEWAQKHFAISETHPWRTIAPLARDPMTPARDNLFFIGDAARVVEPFTGEGIYYALASGELTARHIFSRSEPKVFNREHARLYRDRLWVNRIARAAVTHPQLGSAALGLLRRHPRALRFMAEKVLGAVLA